MMGKKYCLSGQGIVAATVMHHLECSSYAGTKPNVVCGPMDSRDKHVFLFLRGQVEENLHKACSI